MEQPWLEADIGDRDIAIQFFYIRANIDYFAHNALRPQTFNWFWSSNYFEPKGYFAGPFDSLLGWIIMGYLTWIGALILCGTIICPGVGTLVSLILAFAITITVMIYAIVIYLIIIGIKKWTSTEQDIVDEIQNSNPTNGD